MRVVQLRTDKTRGSQKWIQDIINNCPEVLNALIRKKIPSLSDRKILWVSPLEQDGYAEYRDAEFLKKLELAEYSEKLNQFWPTKGPQWDALGKTSDNEAFFLVEAKANVPELCSFCSAQAEESLEKISKSLSETQRWLNCTGFHIDWKYGFYQYANRLAHLYFLREKAKKEAYLVFLYFLNDPTHIFTSRDAWNSALGLQKKLMGLSGGRLACKVIELFISTDDIKSF